MAMIKHWFLCDCRTTPKVMAEFSTNFLENICLGKRNNTLDIVID